MFEAKIFSLYQIFMHLSVKVDLKYQLQIIFAFIYSQIFTVVELNHDPILKSLSLRTLQRTSSNIKGNKEEMKISQSHLCERIIKFI